jgi:diguanylate cyclase (GGDEF)-like protein
MRGEIVYSAILLLVAVGMSLTLLSGRRSPLVPFSLALPQWALAVTITPLGLFLMALARADAGPWLALLGKLLIAAGYALFVGALVRAVGFRCTPRLRALVFAPVLLVLLASALLLILEPGQDLRSGLLSLVLAGYSLVALLLAWSDRERGSTATLALLAAGFGIALLVHLLRGLWLIVDPSLYFAWPLLERGLLALGVLAPMAASLAFALTASNRLLAEFAQLAHRDELTGLPNRRAFQRQGARLYALSQPGRLAAVAIDIDHFKRINDSLGHGEGDRVLVRTAAALATCTDAGDLLARVGGEEFFCLLPGADLAQGERVAERMRLAVLETFASEPVARLRVSVSIGVALRRVFDRDLEGFLERADQALLAAKALGRNRVVTDATPLKPLPPERKVVAMRRAPRRR